jgi:hypothetical protein
MRYVHAASALDEPRLLEMVRDGSPVYAWPYEERYFLHRNAGAVRNSNAHDDHPEPGVDGESEQERSADRASPFLGVEFKSSAKTLVALGPAGAPGSKASFARHVR